MTRKPRRAHRVRELRVKVGKGGRVVVHGIVTGIAVRGWKAAIIVGHIIDEAVDDGLVALDVGVALPVLGRAVGRGNIALVLAANVRVLAVRANVSKPPATQLAVLVDEEARLEKKNISCS